MRLIRKVFRVRSLIFSSEMLRDRKDGMGFFDNSLKLSKLEVEGNLEYT
jgi:hypothetical protein